MPPAGFKPAIPASKQPQIHSLDHVATGIDKHKKYVDKYLFPGMLLETTIPVFERTFCTQMCLLQTDEQIRMDSIPSDFWSKLIHLIDARKRRHVQDLRHFQVSDKCLHSLGTRMQKFNTNSEQSSTVIPKAEVVFKKQVVKTVRRLGI